MLLYLTRYLYLFVFSDYHVNSLVSEEFIPNEQSSIVLIGFSNWLNIVLDINGILCYCMEKKATNMVPFVNSVQ